MVTQVKSTTEILAMRESGHMLATVLSTLRLEVMPGMSTKQLSDIAAKELKSLGGKAAFLGYQGFPDIICISLNDEVVHGIPMANRIIQDGDVVSLDFGVDYNGMITDSALSLIAGKVRDPRDAELVINTEKSLEAGINALHEGVQVGDISAAVEAVLSSHHYGIVRDLVGHGVGHQLHEDPNVPNYGIKGTGMHLNKNMTIAIEPMATLGTYHVYIADDGWTVLTEDHSRSAHFEHTVLITEDGAEVLTKR